MNCTEEFIAKMKQKDIVINFVQAWRNDTLEESYARLDKPTRLHAYSVSKSVTSIGVGLPCRRGCCDWTTRCSGSIRSMTPQSLHRTCAA